MSGILNVLETTAAGPIVVFILGLILGSYFNVLIYRLPLEKPDKRPRSHCPKCGALIPWYLNLPVVSFMYLRGKAACCRKRISWEYPAVEIATALLFLGTFLYFGFTNRFLAYTLFLSYLLIISVIDLHHRIIPDELSLSGIVLGFLASFWIGDVTWQSSGLGILVGGGIFLGISYGYEKATGREGLGGGDVKLLAMQGAWLGVESILVQIVLSSAVGSIIGLAVMAKSKDGLQTAIPFGPFLAAAAVIYLFFGSAILGFIFPPIL